MLKTTNRCVLVITLAGVLALTGCASGPNPAAGQPTEGVIHVVSPADLAFIRSTEPIATDMAKLWINGMGCPQCVTNVDEQLERQFKATDIIVDLEAGVVTARFPDRRPSPAQLNNAVKDAGLTLVKVEAN